MTINMPNRRNRNKGSRSARTLGANISDKMVRKRNSRSQHRLGLPPDVQSGQRIIRTVRWSCTSTSEAFTLRSEDLFDLFFFATGSTAGYRLYDAMRIKNIRLICPPPSSGMSSVTLGFPQNQVSTGIGGCGEYITVPSSMSVPGKWTGPPPSGSLAGMWVNQLATYDLFSVQTSSGYSLVGAMVDLTLECVNAFQAVQTAVASTISGAQTGRIYTRPLDFPNGGTSFWEPSGNVNSV